jgi:hypothetical protein
MQQLILGAQPSVSSHVTPRDALCAIANEPTPEKAQDCVLERGSYRVHLADSSGQYRAGMLVERMYSWRGYHTETLATLPDSPNRIALQASQGERLFGTLTAGLDSEEGLLADVLYPGEVNTFRAMGRKLCEMSKLAVDPEYGSKEVLASLFHLAYIYVHIIHKATDVLIEVNPRHAAFYGRRLGFHQIGEMRTCPRVNAPAVLLHIELSYMQAQISRHGGSRDTKEKSLYPYFFSTLQEDLPGQKEDRDSEGRLAA